nr:hypothetical protein [Tanacetum cinerariifolium]
MILFKIAKVATGGVVNKLRTWGCWESWGCRGGLWVLVGNMKEINNFFMFLSFPFPTQFKQQNTHIYGKNVYFGLFKPGNMGKRAPRSQERGRKETYRQGSKAEEKTPKTLMAIDGVGWDWSYMANEREDHALVADTEATTKFALMANTESKVFDNSLCSKDFVAQLKGRLVEYKEREVKYIEKNRTLKLYRESNLTSIESLSKKLDTLKLEKDGVEGKLAGLLKASKNLDNLIESQRSDKVKDGVGYNAVRPPAADLYLSPKKDLSWAGLPEFVDDTVTDYSRPSPTIVSTSTEGQNKNSTTSEDVASPNTPKPFVKFVKPKDSQSG